MDTKTCTSCHQTKPLTAFRKRGDSQRYRSHCRECLKHSARIYKTEHKENIRAYKKQYQIKHFERDREKRHLGYKKWKERLLQQGIRYHYVYYHSHAESKRLSARQYAKHHRATIRRKENISYHAHPEHFKAKFDRHRARKAGAPISDLTAAQWREILAAYGHRCVYCGDKKQRLTKDHIIPLSKGGNHSVDNVVPACRSCNSRKQAGPPLTPVQPLLLTIAPSKKKKAS
jgi:5-methylcytosine-specific restriction endonuclease McrA